MNNSKNFDETLEMKVNASTSFKSRGSKRLVWRVRELDDRNRIMYEEVLQARKERNRCKHKSIRYSFVHSLQN